MQELHFLNPTLAIKHVDHESELGKMHTAALGEAWVFPALSQLMACAGGREELYKSCICSCSSLVPWLLLHRSLHEKNILLNLVSQIIHCGTTTSSNVTNTLTISFEK